MRACLLFLLICLSLDQSLGSQNATLAETGEPLLIYIANIESPICRECEEVLSAQTKEIATLYSEHPDASIIAVNIRKNPYSEDGRSLALSWWGVNATWPWIEDYQPYPVAGRYMEYWSNSAGFSNPTILIVNSSGAVVKVYHVYQIGKGLIDGIQSSEKLYSDLRSADVNEKVWFSGSDTKTSLIGMFALGIMTSLSPCSVALLAALFSYMISRKRRESGTYSREGLLIGISFTTGMALVFFVIGLFVSQLGIFVRSARFFDLIAGLILVTLGINALKPLSEIIPISRQSAKDSYLQRVINTSVGLFERSSTLGAFFLGVVFSLGWAPCAISLVFPVIIWLVSQEVSPLGGGLMLFIFGLGHGIPVIPLAALSKPAAARIADRYISAGEVVMRIFGIAIIALGILFGARYLGFALW